MEKKAVGIAALAGLGAYVLLSRGLRKPKKLAYTGGRVPIFIMMPLDTVNENCTAIKDLPQRKAWLRDLAKSGVTGIMVDVWWGLCEQGPGSYYFDGYMELVNLCKELGLKVQAVMSFHGCGGNVGDSINIPIPSFALEVAERDGFLYKDGCGRISKECLSLSADNQAIFAGPKRKRTALKLYEDFMSAFANKFAAHLGETIVEIQVGMGPCGELRYPSYMLSEGWNYPGVGLICAHDVGMTKLMRSAWITAPAGEPKEQNGKPSDCQLFHEKEGYQTSTSSYDAKFMEWYREVLFEHGEAVLRAATASFPKTDGLAYSVKVSGIHWHTMHSSRAAEACAGYVPEASGYGAYSKIAARLAKVAKDCDRPVFFNFTCLEMTNYDGEGMPQADSAPEDLIAEVRRACIANNVPLCGENALQFGLPESPWALNQIRKQARGWATNMDKMHSITLLRLDENFARASSLAALKEWISCL